MSDLAKRTKMTMASPRAHLMRLAIEEAMLAGQLMEVPVGAVIVDGLSGAVLARAGNRVETSFDPTAHAELLAIRAACARWGVTRLVDCDLYVTLEPCAMCAAAIAFARIRRLYFGAYDSKGGAVEHGPRFFAQLTCHHRPDWFGGIDEQECARLLRSFFHERR